MAKISGLVMTMFFFSFSVYAQERPSLIERKYREGETYRYRITSEQQYGGVWNATSVAVCELKVIKDINGVYHDAVRWISMQTFSPKDTIDASAQAEKVAPYRISLHPKGKLEIPKISVASMTGMITDFNTFFVAISPQLGVTGLQTEGDTLLNARPVTGDFSNGKTILYGMDCIQTSARIEAVNPSLVSLTTCFLPPQQSCLSYLLPEMNTPVVKDTLNNFQMVVPVGNDRFNVQYGREFFTIRSTVRRSDGKLASAVMDNTLTLKLKLNCNSVYQDCKGEFPFTIQRTVTLELLPETYPRQKP